MVQLDTQCELAARRHFLRAPEQQRVQSLLAEVGRITHALARSLDPTL
jgi:hypothetical protein